MKQVPQLPWYLLENVHSDTNMSIRQIASDLYKISKEIEVLEEKLKSTSLTEKAKLETKIAELKQQKDELRRRLDGMKETPPPI